MTGERENPISGVTDEHTGNVEVELARLGEQLHGLRNEMQLQRAADQEAVKTALAAQKELAQKHNDLISQMEKRDAAYLTKDDYEQRHEALKDRVSLLATFQARIGGGLMVVAFIGVANFVKLWTG